MIQWCSNPHNRSVVKKLFMYSILIISVPLVTYFFVLYQVAPRMNTWRLRFLTFSVFVDPDSFKGPALSAAAAVIGMHVVIIMYIIDAFKEAEPPTKTVKSD